MSVTSHREQTDQLRLLLMRDLERSIVDRAPEHVALLAEIRELIRRTEEAELRPVAEA